MELLFGSDLAELCMGSDYRRADEVDLVHVFREVVGYGLACSLESHFSFGDINGDGNWIGLSSG